MIGLGSWVFISPNCFSWFSICCFNKRKILFACFGLAANWRIWFPEASEK